MVEPMIVTRIVSTPEVVDTTVVLAGGLTVMRTAPDELLILGDVVDYGELDDPHAIVVSDTGWAGVWLEQERAAAFLLSECEWPLPAERPAFAQGMVSHLAVKLYLEEERTLILVPSAMAAELEARLAH